MMRMDMVRVLRWLLSSALFILIPLSTCIASDIDGSQISGSFEGVYYKNNKIAGTYLSITSDGAVIMHIHADGTLSMILSEQFAGGGVIGESYSNGLGTWKWTGWLGITATTVDIGYEPSDGAFVGVSAARNWITFSSDFDTATLTCEGAVFPPGVNPFESGAEPIPGSEYTCGELVFHRIPVNTE
jgi:hypothetical protein